MKNHGKILGIIPARGGSKGIHRKNIYPLNGRPLLSYTIEAALASNTLDRVIVSTDDAEIADIASQKGVEVPFMRPAAFSTDTASSLSVALHALTWLDEFESYSPEAVALLSPTCPLRTSEQIDATAASLWQSGLDSAICIYPVQNHPYFIFRLDGHGRLTEVIKSEQKPLRRQDLPPFFAISQSVAISLTDYLRHSEDPSPIVNFKSLAGHEIDQESALDIDTQMDLLFAEVIMKQRDLKSNVLTNHFR